MNSLLSIHFQIFTFQISFDSSINCVIIDENNSRDIFEFENLQRMYPFKKRKFFNQNSSSTSDRGSQCQGMFDSSDTTRVNGTNHGTSATMLCCLLHIFLCNICQACTQFWFNDPIYNMQQLRNHPLQLVNKHILGPGVVMVRKSMK